MKELSSKAVKVILQTIVVGLFFFVLNLIVSQDVAAVVVSSEKHMHATELADDFSFPGNGEGVALELCNGTVYGSQVAITATGLNGGYIVNPTGVRYEFVSPGCRTVNYSVGMPSVSENSCLGFGNQVVSFIFSASGWGTTSAVYTMLGRIELRVNNNTASRINVTVEDVGNPISTNPEGSTFPIDPGPWPWGINASWWQNCSVNSTAFARVKAVRASDGANLGSYYVSGTVKNGCYVILTIDIPGGGTPPPTPVPTPPPYTPPSNLTRTPGCYGAFPFVVFKWQNGTSGNIWLDVDYNNNYNDGFWNKQIGPNDDFTWSKFSTLSSGKAPPNAPATFYWRLWDGTNHVSGASFSTTDCYDPPEVEASTGCYGEVVWVIFDLIPPRLGGIEDPQFTLQVGPNANWADGFYNKGVTGLTQFGWWSSSTMNGPIGPVVPAYSTTYNFRLDDGDHGQASHFHSNGSITTPNCYQAPFGMNVSSQCTNNGSFSVTFSGSYGSRKTPFQLQVSTVSTFATYETRDIPQSTTNSWSTVWDTARPLSNNYVPTADTQYYWRIYDGTDHLGGSHWHYPTGLTTSTTGPGDAFTTSHCYDLKIEFLNSQTSFQSNATATFTVRVTNKGPLTSFGGAAFNVGFWPQGSENGILTDCDPNDDHNVTDYRVGTGNTDQGFLSALAPNTSQDFPFSFNVGAVARSYTAYAYADWRCIGTGLIQTPTVAAYEVNWKDNKASKSYQVNACAWFEVVGGDVGANQGIDACQVPPSGSYHGNYLTAAKGTVGPNVRGVWLAGTYPKDLIAQTSVYGYFEDLRKTKADDFPVAGNPCQITGGLTGFRYCTGSAEFNTGTNPTGTSVWFINGNLAIKKSLTVAAADSVVFIVKGTITIENAATRADGVYITNSTFNDTTGGASATAGQLVINGAVYANNLKLLRTLVSGNDTTAADRVVYEPKYLILLNNLLASPSLKWEEVAP